MQNKLKIGCVILSVLLAACASNQSRPDTSVAPGTKRAWIVGFYEAATPRSEMPACLAALSPDEFAAKRYVRLHYRHVRKMITEVAAVPEGVEVKLDEVVEVVPRDCDRGDLSRITRVLPAETH